MDKYIRLASLGLSRVEQIVKDICGNLLIPKICRLDWAADFLDKNPWDLAVRCRVSGVQSSRFYRSRVRFFLSALHPRPSHFDL
jgi:hypothetical protein